MIPSISNATDPTAVQATSAPAGAPSAGGVDGLANEQTFLKLFVAQLENQDPLQPQDGIQFVTQLAQFSSLEQEVQMRQDLDALKTSGIKTDGGNPAPLQP